MRNYKHKLFHNLIIITEQIYRIKYFYEQIKIQYVTSTTYQLILYVPYQTLHTLCSLTHEESLLCGES